jgi:hypothetical protein
MSCFPQLLTGASGQYPIRKRSSLRTIRNQCLDGREIKVVDAAASSIDWQLTFQELIDDEMASLRDFFVSMEGSLGSFTFLDPTDNLLAWSEKFDEPVWQADPLLQVGGGAADPFGTALAFHIINSAGAPLRLRQTLNVPGGYYYSLSLWARSDQPGAVTLLRGGEINTRATGQTWSRLTFASASMNSDETVVFGIELAPEASVDLFGAQVEAQIGASLYKKTTSAGGIYSGTRFGDDGLGFSTLGPGRHGCVIHLRTCR